MKYFINFVGECVFNPDYDGYTAGRCEIIFPDGSIEEYRYFTNDTTFESFVDFWDFKYVNEEQLHEITSTLKNKYNETTTL